LYIRGVIDDYEYPKGDQVGNPVREAYTARLGEVGAEALWEELKERDPESAALIHPNNTKRVIRAFEMLAQGTTYARQNARLKVIPQVVPASYLALSVDPEVLNDRIAARVDSMVESGLIDEVRNLLDRGFREAVTAPQAIGYKEIVAALDGRCSMDEAVEQIKTATRRYAKRQRSWLRGDARVEWIEATDTEGLLDRTLERIM
jgi:tRNA dimethylallyltransferase